MVHHYYDPHRQPAEVKKALGLTYHGTPESLLKVCEVVNLMMPPYPETTGFFNDAMFAQMKHGSYLINCARGALSDRDAAVRATDSGKIAGYAGEVWYPARSVRSPLDDDASQRHDSPNFGYGAVRAGSISRGNVRDSGVLV
jgi:lactate dehydrogenase-like 2-hydroxyacid dehydrogenase